MSSGILSTTAAASRARTWRPLEFQSAQPEVRQPLFSHPRPPLCWIAESVAWCGRVVAPDVPGECFVEHMATHRVLS
jgi:hypothetical protein